MGKNKVTDFFEEAQNTMSEKAFNEAVSEGQEINTILNLAKARKAVGKRQIDMDNFTQSEISRIEGRADIKLSTLVEYMKSLGLGIKIVGYDEESSEEFEILKTAK